MYNNTHVYADAAGTEGETAGREGYAQGPGRQAIQLPAGTYCTVLFVQPIRFHSFSLQHCCV